MTHEPTIEQLLAPSPVLSRALDFMQTDLDADAYDVIAAWISRAIRELRQDISKAQAVDQEVIERLSAVHMKIERSKLWLRIFEEIQGAITPYGSEWQP